MKATKVLRSLRYPAIVLAGLSVPLFGIIALTFLLFCDSGPISRCFFRAALAAAIPVLQIISLIKALSLLKQQRRLLLSAALMALNTLPVLIVAIYFALAI